MMKKMNIKEVLESESYCNNCWMYDEGFCLSLQCPVPDDFICDTWWHKEGRPEDFERYQNDEY